MTSIKSRLLILLLKLLNRKGDLKDAESLKQAILKRREKTDYRPDQKICARLDIEEKNVDGFPVYIVKPKGLEPKHHIFYLHGGAYVFEIIPPHWTFVADFAEQTGAAIMVPIYPLAPEHDAERALGFADAAYRMFQEYADGASIHMMGDSAGGGMATALAQRYVAEEHTLPESLILVSPWFDVALDNPEIDRINDVDPWLAPGGLKEAGRLYANGLSLDDPRVSPMHGQTEGLPPTHIFIGTRDLLLPDCKRFADKLTEAGTRMSYTQAEGMFHCWPLLRTREGLAARADMAAVVTGARV